MRHYKIYLLIFISLAGICGCYPVHTIEKYSSKEEYYKDANSAFEGKEVKVSLAQSDSVFYAEDAIIYNDSIRFTLSKEWETKNIKWSDVKSAAYFNKDYDNLCAHFNLLSGDTLNLEKIVFNPDSSIDYQVLNIKTVRLPLKDIKNIRYKNYWSIPFGFVLGAIAGLETGRIWQRIEDNKPKPVEDLYRPTGGQGEDHFSYLFWPTVAGPPIGIIAGWIIGGRTTWEFNK